VPMKKYLTWDPAVHQHFRDELAFVFISVYAFSNDTIYDDLKSFLIEGRYTSFRLYRVFGTFDIILKVWVGHRDHHKLRDNLSRLAFVEKIEAVVVDQIPYPSNNAHESRRGSIAKLLPNDIERIQYFFDKPETWGQEPVMSALANSVVHIVDEMSDELMIFFVCIKHEDTKKLEARTLMREIKGLCERSPKLEKSVIYQMNPYHYSFVVKLQTKHLYEAGRFVIELNNKFAVQHATTETYVVMDPETRASESIGKRSFDQVDVLELLLPELAENDSVRQDDKIKIKRWMSDQFIPRVNGLTPPEREAIAECLRAVLADDKSGFDSAVEKPFREVEGELSRLQWKFIEQLGMDPQKTTQAALKRDENVDNKKLDLLSLGDRIDICVFAIKQESLTSDEDVLDDWKKMVEVRNEAAHGNKNLFQKWDERLTLLIRFIPRGRKLLELIKPYAEGTRTHGHLPP
jgi:hypothetical protein